MGIITEMRRKIKSMMPTLNEIIEIAEGGRFKSLV